MTCNNNNNLKFPCGSCAKNVHDKDKAVPCNLWEHRIRVKYNNFHYLDYQYLQRYNESWYCIEFCSKIFPFTSLSCDKNLLDVAPTLIVVLCSGKDQKVLKIAQYY